MGLVVLTKMLPRAVQASLHRGHAGGEDRGDLGMAAPFLHEGEQRAILRPQVLEGVPQRVEFLGVDRSRRLGDILVLRGEGQEDPPQLLAAQLVDAGVAGETEKPRLELRGSLQAVDGADHLDEDLLAEVLHLIAAVGDGEDEAGHPVLIGDDELVQSLLVATLRAAHQVNPICRRGFIHAAGGVLPGKTSRNGERYGAAGVCLAFAAVLACAAATPSTMKPTAPLFSPVAAALLAALSLAAGGCGSGPAPRDLMLEEAGRSAAVERPVAMRGEGTFLNGSLATVATVTRGFDRGNRAPRAKGPGGGPVEGAFDDPSRRRRDDAGAFTEVYHIGGYGDSEEEQKEAMQDYIRQARARRAAGSPMPPVTLKVAFENRGKETLEIEVLDVNSDLGNFAVRPPRLTIPAGGSASLDPMISQLGVTSDEIPLKLALRSGGKRELQVVVIKNVLGGSLRQEFEKMAR